MTAQNAVELGPQALDGAPALLIEEMCAELHCQAVQLLEGVGEQQQLRFRIQRRALHAARIPCRADLHPGAFEVDIHVGGHAHDLVLRLVKDREGQHAAFVLQLEAALDFRSHALGPRDAGVPELPKIAVVDCGDQAFFVRFLQGFQFHMLTAQGHGLEMGAVCHERRLRSFVVLESYRDPCFAVYACCPDVISKNARHLLMGATLYPWLRCLPPGKRYGIMVVISDANWAMAMQRFERGKPGFGVVLGGGLALWVFWVLRTAIGAYFGNVISDPQRFGLDMIMGCFLLSMVVGGEKNFRMVFIWVVAAAASLLAWRFLPENSHVIVGALAGGVVGMFVKEAGDEH